MKASEPWITVKQAAERLGLSWRVIYRLLDQGVLRRVWLTLPNPNKAKSRGRVGVAMESLSQYEQSLRIVNEREAHGFRNARKG